ncbi:hypothetical protein K438DRAFT_1753595 [Mycena galopus ATCC 62051]|nr:hypothetical protein K438DRAFT_1753595 [Mycena galopus ATCC 62051]
MYLGLVDAEYRGNPMRESSAQVLPTYYKVVHTVDHHKMPHPLKVTEIRASNIVAGLKLAAMLFDELNDALGTSSLRAISQATLSLVTALQNVRKDKMECIQLTEEIHGVLYAIISLYLKSEMLGSPPLSMLDHIGKFTETIHKIHTYLEAQQEGTRIRNFFRQNELNTLLKDCHAGLQHAMEAFKASPFARLLIELGTSALSDVAKMQKTADNMHKEILEMIASISNGTNSDRASSFKIIFYAPIQAKKFHSRELELESIVKMLCEISARIAILGAGGMGKTTLVRAALHHPDVVARYEHCFFVPCDSATTSLEIAALIGDHIGLNPGKDLRRPFIRYIAAHSTCLLVLDNLETTWEPLESRGAVENLLSCLTDIFHLALMITMRGAERHAAVGWTHPFLPPLQPLSDDAARRTLFDITDNIHDPKDIDQALKLPTTCHWLLISLPIWSTRRAVLLFWLAGQERRRLCFLWAMTIDPI